MNVKFKYLSIYLNVIFIQFGVNRGHVISKYLDEVNTGEARIKRQAGYVYNKPTVSFDLPTATSIASTQAPTVDRIQMQMYYAYPVPAVDAGANVNIGQQNTGASAGSTAAVTSSANGYSYGSSSLTDTQNIVNGGYQNSGVTGTQAVITSGSNGYSDGRPASVSTTGSTGGTVSTNAAQTQNIVSGGYQNSGVTGSQAVITSGSTGYGDGRPVSVSTVGSTSGSVSNNARRYLPPASSGENTVSGTVTTSNQAQSVSTITQSSESYIPPTAQISSSQNDQTVTITQSALNKPPATNPNTSYLLPQSAPKITIQKDITQSVPDVLTQQYIPPIESPIGQKTIQQSIATPASTYLPPVF